MSVSGFSTDSSAESDESIACSDKDNLPPKGRKPHQPETQLAQFAASAMDAVSDAGSLDEDALLSGPDCSDNEAHAKSRCSRSSLDAHQPHCKLKSSAFAEQRTTQQWFRDLDISCLDKKSLRSLKRKVSMDRDKLAKRAAAGERKFEATAIAYNKGQLSRGDRVDPQTLGPARRHNSTWTHRNAWTLDGTINLAFSLIGKLSPDANSLKKTRREVDAIAAVALAAASRTQGACRTFCDSIEFGGREMPWLIIDRSTDTTPLRVQFGHMLKELAQAARYWHWCSASRTWSLLSSCDYRQAAGMLPKSGILETLAQTVQIIYPLKRGSFVQVRRRKLRSPTCFLQNSTGSNMLAALEASPAALSIANLLKLARTGLKFIFVGHRGRLGSIKRSHEV